MNTPTEPDCQVLVVGAGPTGLTLAAQLLSMGIRTRVIDKGTGPVPLLQSRALGIHARTLEVLDSMHVVDAFLDEGHRVPHLRMYAGKRNLLDLDLAHNGSRFGFVLHLPQSRTEVLLRARVEELGGTVEQGMELVRLVERGDGVDATLRDAAGREIEARAGHVVGCDGAHSRVRHEIDLPFLGQPYAQDWMLADVALDGPVSDDSVHLFFRPDGLPLACIPLGDRRWRLVMANAGARGGRPPTFTDVREVAAERAPVPLELGDPTWVASFACHLRSTTRYRRGRILIAGDAAHIHSPAGGQGMNTGMTDAHNLAWKLALVVLGRAPDAILDTYGQERVPVASGVLGLTDQLVGLLTMRNRAKRVVRDTVMPLGTRLPAAQRRGARRISQLAVAYPPGRLVQPGGPRRGPRPGERLADVDVVSEEGTTPVHRLLSGGRHVLIVSNPEVRARLSSTGFARYSDLVDVVDADLQAAFVLVRPDGVVGACGSVSETRRVLDYLHRLCGADEPDPRSAVARRPLARTAG